MKRFFAMILVLVMTCLPVMGLAEEFVLPEKLTDLIPDAETLLSDEPPVKAPQMLVSETGEVFFYCEPKEESTSIQFEMDVFMQNEFIQLENTEENMYRFPDGEKVLAAVEQGEAPELHIYYWVNDYYYNWSYWSDSQIWHASLSYFGKENVDFFAHWMASDRAKLYCPEHSNLKYKVEFYAGNDTGYEGEYDEAFCLLPHND